MLNLLIGCVAQRKRVQLFFQLCMKSFEFQIQFYNIGQTLICMMRFFKQMAQMHVRQCLQTIYLHASGEKSDQR